jgi:hypothetical protein
MVQLTLGAIAASFFLAITKDKNAFSNCPARIEALFVVSPISMLILAKTIDRFSAVVSAFAKSLP